MKRFWQIIIISTVLFFVPWLILFKLGINSLPIQSQDTVPALFTPISILEHGNLYLDEYYNMMIKEYPNTADMDQSLGLTPYYLRKVDTHYVSAFPLIISLLALPVYILPVLLHVSFTWNTLAILGHLSGSLILAFAGGFFYLLLKDIFKLDSKKSLMLTGIYLFGTVNFAMISQALWQHGALQLFSILGLYFLLFYTQQSFSYKHLFLSGLFFGLAALSRPTAALTIILVGLYIGMLEFKQPQKLLKSYSAFSIGVLLNVLFFVIYNGIFYKSVENQGYANQLFKNWVDTFPVSFFGVWISPSKGILVYSPVFVFSLVGAWRALKSKSLLNILFTIIIVLHTLVISFWKYWFGGWSYGYRLSSDVIPYLVLLLIPYINSPLYEITKKIFFTCIVTSVLIELTGLVYFDGIWHAAYDRGYTNIGWLWSIKDSEFVFYARRILVKLHLLRKACPTCL